MPRSPVQALALPELMMMARARPPATRFSDSSTGAARTWFWVKTAAAGTSSSAQISARSGRGVFLMPTWMPAKRKPGQAGGLAMCSHTEVRRRDQERDAPRVLHGMGAQPGLGLVDQRASDLAAEDLAPTQARAHAV